MLLCMGGAFLAMLYMYQEKLLYQPRAYPQFAIPSQNPEGYRSPEEHGLQHESVYLTTSDGLRLHAWLVSKKDTTKPRPTLLFFHANAANMGFRLHNIKQLCLDVGVNVFIVSYRGYGESEGEPGEAGMLLDAEAAWQYLRAPERTNVDRECILVFGRSLGGAVSVALAARYPGQIKGLILENTFTCISDMVNTLFPFLKHFKKWILRLDWNSARRIQAVTSPILFISGLKDEVVPAWHMQALHKAAVAAEKKTMVVFENGKHNDTWLLGEDKYIETLRAFISGTTGLELDPVPTPSISSVLRVTLPQAQAAQAQTR